MTLLDDPRTGPVDAPEQGVIDLTDEEPAHRSTPHARAASRRLRATPGGRIAYRGMRVRRVRLRSLAVISFVFWLLAFGVLVGTSLVLWGVADAFGYIQSFEETMTTSLGLERFTLDGGALFGIVVGGAASLCVLGWLGTIAMAAVYNATAGAFGGLALETGPLARRRRALSWRHRGLVTVDG